MITKQELLEFGYFIDNEYLDAYVTLIENNIKTEYVSHRTQYHHVIPQSYCKQKQVEQTYPVCTLLYSDHILAHYYLSLCCNDDTLISFNIAAVNYMTNNERVGYLITKEWLDENLPRLQELYEYVRLHTTNVMFVDEHRKKHDSIMRSDEVRSKISEKMKEKAAQGETFGEEHRKNLSNARKGKIYIHNEYGDKVIDPKDLDLWLSRGYVRGHRTSKEGAVTPKGKIRIYNGEIEKSINPEDLPYYEKLGFHKGTTPFSDEARKKMSLSHIGNTPGNKGKSPSEETKNKLKQAFIGRKWMTNGVIQKQVKPEEFKLYEQNGYTYGKLPSRKGGGVE